MCFAFSATWVQLLLTSQLALFYNLGKDHLIIARYASCLQTYRCRRAAGCPRLFSRPSCTWAWRRHAACIPARSGTWCCCRRSGLGRWPWSRTVARQGPRSETTQNLKRGGKRVSGAGLKGRWGAGGNLSARRFENILRVRRPTAKTKLASLCWKVTFSYYVAHSRILFVGLLRSFTFGSAPVYHLLREWEKKYISNWLILGWYRREYTPYLI